MALDVWAEQVACALGLDGESVDVRLLLEVARDAAHGVERPAAPLTTYLVGVAVGRGVPLADAVEAVRVLLVDRGAGGTAEVTHGATVPESPDG